MKNFLQLRVFGLLRAFSRLVTFGAAGTPAAQTTALRGSVRTQLALEGRARTVTAVEGRAATVAALEGRARTVSALVARVRTGAALRGTVRTFPGSARLANG